MSTPTTEPVPTTEAPQVDVDVGTPPVPSLPVVVNPEPTGTTIDLSPNLCPGPDGTVFECVKVFTTEPCVIQDGRVVSGDCSINGPVPEPDTGYVPFVRGEAIYLGTTPAGDCVSGSTQWTYEPCGDALAPQAVVGVDPASQTLPVTGNNEAIAGMATGCLMLGAIFVWLSTRGGHRT